MQTSQNASSPAFFTGCGTSKKSSAQLCNLPLSIDNIKLSPEDFNNLKRSLDILQSLKGGGVQGSPSLLPPQPPTVRRTLLPLPVAYRKDTMVESIPHENSNVPSHETQSLPNPQFTWDKANGIVKQPLLQTPPQSIPSVIPENFAMEEPQIPKVLISMRQPSKSVDEHSPHTLPSQVQVIHLDTPEPPIPIAHIPVITVVESQITEVPVATVDPRTPELCETPHRNLKRKWTECDDQHSTPPPFKKFSRQHFISSYTQPGNDVWEQLTHDIWQLYADHKQTSEVYEMKMKLRNELHKMLQHTFPSCGLYVVGSSMTGLGANSSDMDMCLMLSHSEIDQRKEATEILHMVYDTFSHYEFLTDVELIPAKVPILRFRDSVSAIEVDLNINNAVGIRNTQLLTSYAQTDERVPPLVLLTKLWARYHRINDAKNHTLSSYSLVLMVIHFLQYGCHPPVLPCLQKMHRNKFLPYSDVRTLKLVEDLPQYTSPNTESLASLFLNFLSYLATGFDFSKNAMSVRLGGVIPKHVAASNTSPKNKRAHWKHICIEEPFDLTNTACSVFKDSAFFYMKDVFLRSWNSLRNTGHLRQILDVNCIQ